MSGQNTSQDRRGKEGGRQTDRGRSEREREKEGMCVWFLVCVCLLIHHITKLGDHEELELGGIFPL